MKYLITDRLNFYQALRKKILAIGDIPWSLFVLLGNEDSFCGESGKEIIKRLYWEEKRPGFDAFYERVRNAFKKAEISGRVLWILGSETTEERFAKINEFLDGHKVNKIFPSAGRAEQIKSGRSLTLAIPEQLDYAMENSRGDKKLMTLTFLMEYYQP